MVVKRFQIPFTAIFRLGGGRAKSQPLNVGLRPVAWWDPSSKISIFELGGTGRRGVKQAGVLRVATTPDRGTAGTHSKDNIPGISQGYRHCREGASQTPAQTRGMRGPKARAPRGAPFRSYNYRTTQTKRR